MNKIENYFDFGINKTFISPLYPKKGETIKLTFLSRRDISYIRLNYKENGNWNSIYLKESTVIDDIFSFFNGDFKIIDHTLLYFTIELDSSFYYYSKLGFTVAQPCDFDCFKVKVDIESPNWVSNSTCYQIFPDRFKNGNKEIGVIEGEYEFDGGYTKVRDFNQKPLNFDEGRCLDFFNGDLKGVEDSLLYLKSFGIN